MNDLVHDARRPRWSIAYPVAEFEGSPVSPSESHVVYIGMGSNLGDRAGNLRTALTGLMSFGRVEETSFLYETPPAYVTDQPAFLNAVCRLRTELLPRALLERLKALEQDMGRQRTIRYGPRRIDLDILFYDDAQLQTDGLIVPHLLLAERDFVLAPLCDLDPDLHHPATGESVQSMWQALGATPLPRVLPLGSHMWTWGSKTYLMGILNVTPDSFSGDGVWTEAGTEQVVDLAVTMARRYVEEGADCIDIGGQSSRPGHHLVPVEEEMARVLPVVRALRQEVAVPISVDTFRAGVALEALRNGAHLINDVWAMRFDPAIGAVAAQSGAALALMHNSDRRLDAGYPRPLRDWQMRMDISDIVGSVRVHLAERMRVAQSMGVARWQLLADPGMGFGKELPQNLELIRRLGEIRELGYPLLFGASRKGFIGKTLGGLPPHERLEGTIAANVLAAVQGADVVRVHDVQATARALRMADAVLHGTAPTDDPHSGSPE